MWPGRELLRPSQGVCFGEWGSRTTRVLNRTKKDDAIAGATADVFALGECDALLIPDYSNFSQIGIIQMRNEGRRVFLIDKDYPIRFIVRECAHWP